MGGGAGDESAAAQGDRDRQGVVDVALLNLLRADDATEGGEPGGNRGAAALALRAERAPAVGGGQVAAAGGPTAAAEARQPHVELLIGVEVDDDEVMVGAGFGRGAEWNVEADHRAAVVHAAPDGVKRIAVVREDHRASPGGRVGEVGTARRTGNGRLHHTS